MGFYNNIFLLFNGMRIKQSVHLLNSCRILLRNYSKDKPNPINRYKVYVIPALQDNFMYLLTDKVSNSALAVDPVEPAKIFNILEQEKVNLNAVLTTHHHLDHCGGNKIIAEKIKDIPIYGGDNRISAITKKLEHNDIFNIGDLSIKCLHTPCHTSGHVSFFMKTNDLEYICFTGDTLFIGGCGRFFEGTAADMLKSLHLLSALPLKTLIYCGHEYTVNNLRFAMAVEPDNQFIKEKLKWVEDRLRKGEHSVPSTIEEELSYNPFMRTDKESIQLCTKQTKPVEVMRVLRKMKDSF